MDSGGRREDEPRRRRRRCTERSDGGGGRLDGEPRRGPLGIRNTETRVLWLLCAPRRPPRRPWDVRSGWHVAAPCSPRASDRCTQCHDIGERGPVEADGHRHGLSATKFSLQSRGDFCAIFREGYWSLSQADERGRRRARGRDIDTQVAEGGGCTSGII